MLKKVLLSIMICSFIQVCSMENQDPLEEVSNLWKNIRVIAFNFSSKKDFKSTSKELKKIAGYFLELNKLNSKHFYLINPLEPIEQDNLAGQNNPAEQNDSEKPFLEIPSQKPCSLKVSSPGMLSSSKKISKKPYVFGNGAFKSCKK